MATQYNPNPSGTTNTTGWSTSATTGTCTITSTVDGLRIVCSSTGTNRYITISGSNTYPTSTSAKAQTIGLQIRRNTAASWLPETFGPISGDSTAQRLGTGFSAGAVGTFITYPATAPGVIRVNYGTFYGTIDFAMTFPDNKPVDITIKGANIYNSTESGLPASAVIDAGDATWTATITDNSRTISVLHNATNNEAVGDINWNWGDGTNSTQSHTNVFLPVSHTYSVSGNYNVTAFVTNYALQSVNSVQTLTVPGGTFAAKFTYEVAYLNVDVDATSSVAPSLDPVDRYDWNWGDGTAIAHTQYASHTYAASGTYNITLTIYTDETVRTSSIVKAVSVASPPDPDNYFTAITNLLDATFNPSITTGSTYAWSFGDGSTSTLQTPTHSYAVGGTYAVTLTVNGSLTVTQNVTVTAVYTPIDNPDQTLRLELSLPQPAGAVYNRLKNPNGEKGAYGWVTPVTGSYIVGSQTSNTTIDKGIAGSKLVYRSSGSGTQTFYTQSVRATAGQYCAAQWISPYVDGYVRATVEAVNNAGTLLGSSATTGYFASSTTVTRRTTPYLLPSGTTFARIRFEHDFTTSNAVPAAGKIVQLRRVMLATAGTSALLASAPYSEFENWVNVIGPTHEISITREALNVGTLNAQILDATLDPAVSNTIRPGQAVRVRANTSDSAGNSVWESLFTGTISTAVTNYVKDFTNNPKKTQINLTASDNITALSQVGEYRGVSAIVDLPTLLESGGVPYEINGSSGQIPASTIVSANDNASLLDQIAITRDNSFGYAFVDRNNVFIARDKVYQPAVPAGIIDESTYSDVDASFSFDECINSVLVKFLRYNSVDGTTEEVFYGPYEDASSIDSYGLHQKEFTFQGATENPTTISTKANAILTANKLPVKHINAVTLPIRYAEDLSTSKALLDLYDLVTLKYNRTGTNQNVRVTGIKHTITPKRWFMELDFGSDGAAASPQITPSPPPVVEAATPYVQTATGADSTITWTSPFGQFDATSNALVYSRVGNLNTLAGSIRNFTTSSAMSATTTIANFSGLSIFRVPPAAVNETTMTLGGVTPTWAQNIRILLDVSGNLRLQKISTTAASPVTSWTMAINEFFVFSMVWITA